MIDFKHAMNAFKKNLEQFDSKYKCEYFDKGNIMWYNYSISGDTR